MQALQALQALHALHALLFSSTTFNSIICFFIQNILLFNIVRYLAGKSAAGLLMVMLAGLRGMLFQTCIDVIWLSGTQRGVCGCPARFDWAEKNLTGATEVK